ncbi:cryptochrome/photolyase family protein [Candidatus Latescibacterota bacterium]
MASSPTIVWLRQDLRLADHPALYQAARRGPVVLVYILADGEEGDWPAGGASRWWLHHSLQRLDAVLRRRGSSLVLRRDSSLEVLSSLAREVGAQAVFWSRRYEPAAVARDEAVAEGLRGAGLEVATFDGSLLLEPWDVATQGGDPYRVFTPFWRACQRQMEMVYPLPVPRLPRWQGARPNSVALEDLGLLPTVDWARGMRDLWEPGEAGAGKALDAFLAGTAAAYGTRRDLPGEKSTSRLSPHLHFGEVSPRQVWHATAQVGAAEEAEPWLRQLGWREFAHHLLYHYPHIEAEPLRPEFADFPWAEDKEGLRAWQGGRTGYPVVDAGMRQLWHTGWMHNRARMVVASFLVKDLLIPWQEGARWFWDTLVDADLANNTLGWQWTAGCGADAAPYFRIFNPVSQGGKFDGDGSYVRRWVPELTGLPDRWIHRPWEAPEPVREDAGVKLGSTYPQPIVDHGQARARALAAFRNLPKSALQRYAPHSSGD